MSNHPGPGIERAKIIQDIADRNTIIQKYTELGVLDRQKAISKIQELRVQNQAVGVVTALNLLQSSTPFSEASDEQIVGELRMQVKLLWMELMGKTSLG